MTTPEHSPLPWHDDGFGIIDSAGKRMCIYGSNASCGPGNEEANRRLIIAAVNSNANLLAAANEALDYLARGKVDRVDVVLRAAIAGAEVIK